ncbi:MAG: type II toxin-antitoxin system VapC family toxin [Brevundimonas sp.]|uniref:type II toxin-antitoxin system VapC family toxin n=1 Tax=Brevundimonas sp. TaxID=1871086 RepID=UPI00391A097A
MSYLIDTNVISEIRKADRCNPAVAAWWSGVGEHELWLSALVLGEIRKGVELARRSDPARAAALEAWLEAVVTGFGNRILGIDIAVAEEWGRMNAIRPVSVIDGLLAATAKVNGLVLVTRNEADVAGLGVALLNPFTATGC